VQTLSDRCQLCGGPIRRQLAEDWPGVHEMVHQCTRCGREQDGWVECHHQLSLENLPQRWEEVLLVRSHDCQEVGAMSENENNGAAWPGRYAAQIIGYGLVPAVVSLILTVYITSPA